jgi:hypothetical protein
MIYGLSIVKRYFNSGKNLTEMLLKHIFLDKNTTQYCYFFSQKGNMVDWNDNIVFSVEFLSQKICSNNIFQKLNVSLNRRLVS